MSGTPKRADGDEALQAFQDALYHRLMLGPGPDARRSRTAVRVFAWTADDTHGYPDMQRAFAVLEEGHRVAEAAIPAEAPGATHSEAPTLLLEVSRLQPVPGTGHQWHGLVPLALRVVRDVFGRDASGYGPLLWLTEIERRVLETFWRSADDAPGGARAD